MTPSGRDTVSFLKTGEYPDEKGLLTSYDEIKDKLEIKPTIVVFGKEVHQRRDVGFFSDSSVGYKYSNKLMKSKPLTPNLKKILEYVNTALSTHEMKVNFNGILINRYEYSDSIGPHSDDETDLDSIGVFSITFYINSKREEGFSERIFRIKTKKEMYITQEGETKQYDAKETVLDITTKHMMTMLMGGKDFQKLFTHEVPPRLKSKGTRISYTFRSHKK